jgi:uncharacterized protein YuzE
MMPTIKYHPEDNAAYIRLSEAKILQSAEVAPDVVFDYDADGRIVRHRIAGRQGATRP